jgi:tRNA A-37 threonylcarbamoyl transferase component Bud32
MPYQHLQKKACLPVLLASTLQDLTQLVQDFHDKGLVHGNLRAANFIVPTDRLKDILLIDFN